jgi:hypothetical protein
VIIGELRGTVTELDGTDQLHPRVTIDTLPDDILLEIFDSYLALRKSEGYRFRYHWDSENAWQTLVHVCKRWRCIVFASPCRLQLLLVCTNERPVQKMLDIWPSLPILVRGRRPMSTPQDANNLITALEQPNRVRKINIVDIPNLFWKKLRAMKMGDPYPALTYLQLYTKHKDAPVLPDSFLGGFAPQLQTISLTGVPFPALPKLLLSTRDLVELDLWDIPYLGYMSPEVMVTGLSALTKLQTFRLEFQLPQPRAGKANRAVPRQTRVLLPALTSLWYRGNRAYWEDIIAQIDIPLAPRPHIRLFN